MGETFRAVAYVPRGTPGIVHDCATLHHDERRVRRRLISLSKGDQVLIDFPNPVTLDDHGLLKLDNGRMVEIRASAETLYEVRGRDTNHLMELCWHVGNRHAKAQIDTTAASPRFLILRDHVLRDMLIGLGATVHEVVEPFTPLEGAYGHDHGHALLNR